MCISEIQRAIDDNNLEFIEEYIESGGDINITNSDGYTMLHLSTINNRIRIMKFLLKNNADPNVMVRGYSPLIYGCQLGHLTAVKLLLESSYPHNNEYYLPMHIAATYGNNKIVRLLHGRGFDINEIDRNGEGYAPIHWATQEKHISTIKTIIDLGGSVDITTCTGATPLYIAASEGFIHIVRLLLHYCDKEIYRGGGIRSPLIVACCYNRIDIVIMLVENGFCINSADESGRTALFYSILYGRRKISSYLLSMGGNDRTIDKFGISIQDLSHKEVVKKVLDEL